jgi:putative restriction endonuclease
VERDEELRAVCFAALDVLRAQFGEDLPYRGGLDRGFSFDGRRVPFLNYQKGIYRAGAQRGPAALSVQTSYQSPYGDEALVDGFSYAYRAGAADQPDNRALQAAWGLGVPLVYFVGTAPWRYLALYPCYVAANVPHERRVVLTLGQVVGGAPAPYVAEVDRVYAVRAAKQRLHQGRFRAIVLPAYDKQCAICRLKEVRLLDAAHIIRDADPEGAAAVRNGLSLCTIHHRAYDENLVGVSPDYRVKVARRLLEDEDGPMLELLKGFHETTILLPSHPTRRPDRERLEARFAEFAAGAG